MRQVILNVRIYAKQKINLTWPMQVIAPKPENKAALGGLLSEQLQFFLP